MGEEREWEDKKKTIRLKTRRTVSSFFFRKLVSFLLSGGRVLSFSVSLDVVFYRVRAMESTKVRGREGNPLSSHSYSFPLFRYFFLLEYFLLGQSSEKYVP